MVAGNKEAILSKTHYGIGIYAHILRLYYPGETVLSLSGRTCSFTKNPFNADKSTLKIYVEKENVLGSTLGNEFARHTDSENAITAGDAFDFAELHYKQSGDELLQTLNKEMNLRIGEKWSFYNQKNTSNPTPVKQREYSKSEKAFVFSFFKAPVRNTIPHKSVSLFQVYNAIKGEFYKQSTENLRSISDNVQVRKYKAANFDYCTFSGVFTSRNDNSLVSHSGLLCVDFDHVQNIDTLRQALLLDEYFDTQLLFVSPSGDGSKWIIHIDTQKAPHGEFFASVANYILQTYSVEVDKSGKDVSRACFLPYDPDVFINPQLLDNNEQENI
jgi:hypothetical protein